MGNYFQLEKIILLAKTIIYLIMNLGRMGKQLHFIIYGPQLVNIESKSSI